MGNGYTMTRPQLAQFTCFCAVLVLTMHTAPAEAQEDQPEKTTVTKAGLDGIYRIGVPVLRAPGVSLMGSAGYGMIDSLGPVKGKHHRLQGNLALGAAIVPQFGAALYFSGVYDKHPDDPQGANSGLIGNPHLVLRGGFEAHESFDLGAEIDVWVPGKDAPSVAFNATSIEAKVLGAITPPDSSLIVAVLAGFRLDNSANAAPELTETRYGDRISLGLSDFHAVLAGLGVYYRLSAVSLVGEFTADLLVGGVPAISMSPMRFDAGLTYHATDGLNFNLLAEVGLSKRPNIEPTDPLIPIEPRFSINLGVSYTWDLGPEPPPVVEEEVEAPKPPPVEAKPVVTAMPVSGQLLDQEGQPAIGVTVRLTAKDTTQEVQTDATGQYRFADVPLGTAKLETISESFEKMEWTVEVAPEMPETAPQTLVAVVTGSQLRGLIRSFGGKGLQAQITIEPGNITVDTDDAGFFQVDIEPGNYTVKIKAPRYRTQTKKVQIEENSVRILNVDLYKRKR